MLVQRWWCVTKTKTQLDRPLPPQVWILAMVCTVVIRRLREKNSGKALTASTIEQVAKPTKTEKGQGISTCAFVNNLNNDKRIPAAQDDDDFISRVPTHLKRL